MVDAKNMITLDMAKNVKYERLNTSDTGHWTWGVYRYAPGGVTDEDKYYYNTRTIGPYTFQEFYGWIDEYYSKVATPPKRYLYKYLLEYKEALACIFVNNYYVARVFPEKIEYIRIDDPIKHDVKYFSEPLEQRLLVEIGWVKTVVKNFSAVQAPWKLYMDISNNMAYVGNGKWVHIDGSPEFILKSDFQLYKTLLTKPDAVAVYRDIQNKDTIFI